MSECATVKGALNEGTAGGLGVNAFLSGMSYRLKRMNQVFGVLGC